MRIALATNHLNLGGSESYLLTLGEQLDRLGHEVVVFSPEPGAGVAVAEERAIPVVTRAERLGTDFDAAVVQDAAVSLEVAEALPAAPQVFVAHSEIFDLQTPPQLPGLVSAVVALNDRVAARIRSLAVKTEVVRLRQPIDVERFSPRAPLPATARRALLLSNTPHADRLALIEEACARAGLELERVGGDRGTADPRAALHRAEIVIGYGRSILEAMACGRAAYVYDWAGGEGWVTPETYPAIEAQGFGGRNGDLAADAGRLAADLGAYDAAMGPANRDLLMANHRANVHAQELVELLRRAAPGPKRERTGLAEMARLARIEWRVRGDLRRTQEEVVRLSDELREAIAERERAVASVHAEARAHAAEIERMKATAGWRLLEPLRLLIEKLRRRRTGP